MGKINYLKYKKYIRIVLYPLVLLYRIYKKKNYEKKELHLNSTFDKIFYRVQPSSLKVKLDEFHGIFEMDIRSDLFRRIALQGHYEFNNLQIILKNIDTQKDAIDIGANIGFFSVFLAKHVKNNCKVLSIEPTENAYNFLENNVEANNCKHKIILFNGALIDKISDKILLNTIEGKEEYSSIGQINENYVRESKVKQLYVQSTNLDTLVEKFDLNPGFIKIDTEGSEYLILKGSVETLKKYKPIILSELCDDFLKKINHSSKDVVNLFEELNYEVINIKEGCTIEHPFNGEIIAIPK